MTSKCVCQPGDVPNHSDINDILSSHPNRLGHALFLSESNKATVREQNIPIEICPSSNMKTMGLVSLNKHPILNSLMNDTPTSINMDDMVVFDICLTDEYWAVAQAYGWDIQNAIHYVEQIIPQILDCSEIVRNNLRDKVEKYKNSMR